MTTNEYKGGVNGLSIVLQLLVGIAGGVALGLVGTAIGSLLTPAGSDPALGGVIGLLAGYPLGTALGVWLVSGERRRRSFQAAVLGAYVGAGLVLLALVAGLTAEVGMLWALIGGVSLSGALTGYYWGEGKR